MLGLETIVSPLPHGPHTGLPSSADYRPDGERTHLERTGLISKLSMATGRPSPYSIAWERRGQSPVKVGIAWQEVTAGGNEAAAGSLGSCNSREEIPSLNPSAALEIEPVFDPRLARSKTSLLVPSPAPCHSPAPNTSDGRRGLPLRSAAAKQASAKSACARRQSESLPQRTSAQRKNCQTRGWPPKQGKSCRTLWQ
jgi:hypothetical protein